MGRQFQKPGSEQEYNPWKSLELQKCIETIVSMPTSKLLRR